MSKKMRKNVISSWAKTFVIPLPFIIGLSFESSVTRSPPGLGDALRLPVMILCVALFFGCVFQLILTKSWAGKMILIIVTTLYGAMAYMLLQVITSVV